MYTVQDVICKIMYDALTRKLLHILGKGDYIRYNSGVYHDTDGYTARYNMRNALDTLAANMVYWGLY